MPTKKKTAAPLKSTPPAAKRAVTVVKEPAPPALPPGVTAHTDGTYTNDAGDQVDSRGRRIGRRGTKGPMSAGLIAMTAEERQTLREVALREPSTTQVSAYQRAMHLDVGESDVAMQSELQSFAMALTQARKRGDLDGREYDYHVASFSPGIGLPAVGVLWITRKA